MFRGNMSAFARITIRCHSWSPVVNDKACGAASLHVPGRPTDGLFLCADITQKHFDRFRWFKHLKCFIGPSFVKKSGGRSDGGRDPRKHKGMMAPFFLHISGCFVDSGAHIRQNTYYPKFENCVVVKPLRSVQLKRTHDIATPI